jgi:hypothetical protein
LANPSVRQVREFSALVSHVSVPSLMLLPHVWVMGWLLSGGVMGASGQSVGQLCVFSRRSQTPSLSHTFAGGVVQSVGQEFWFSPMVGSQVPFALQAKQSSAQMSKGHL